MSEYGLNPSFSLSESMKSTTVSPILDATNQSYRNLEELKKSAFIDNLTGVYNQNAWTDFQKHFDQNRGDKATVIIIDINGLKNMNDRNGHNAGDEYIKKTVLYIQSVFSRIYDKVYRIGGDEIGVVCKYVSPEDKEFKSYISTHFDHDAIEELGLDFAYGIAHTDIQTDTSIKDTIKRADILMYQNKAAIKASSPGKYFR